MKYNKNVYQALMMISQFAINMLVPIFICSFVGMFLDRRFGSSYWTVLLFLLARWPDLRMYSSLLREYMRHPGNAQAEHRETKG